MATDARHRYVLNRIAEAYQLAASHPALEELQHDSKAIQLLSDFFKGPEGPSKILVFFQHVEIVSETGTISRSATPKLQITTANIPRVQNKVLYFVRNAKRAVSTKDADLAQEILCGMIDSSLLQNFEAFLSEVFEPMLKSNPDWGKTTQDQSKDFLDSVNKFIGTLHEVVQVQKEGVELKKVEKVEIPANPALYAKEASMPERLVLYEEIAEEWCAQIEGVLANSETASGENNDEDPRSELEFWKSRMGKFNSITEQLKGRDVKAVLGVLHAGHSVVLKRWKNMDISITDAANEAKDNVKYLTTLEKYFDPMYTGTPRDVIEILPGLMNNIKMMYTISRYYNTNERMTTLFVKITNQMIECCKNAIRGDADKLWNIEPSVLLDNLRLAVELNDAYKEHYTAMRDKLLQQSKGGQQFDLNELNILGKFALFCKRIQKLIDVFSTVEQFTALSRHNIDGMKPLLEKFDEVIGELKGRGYDLLNFSQNNFDNDYIKYNDKTQELETQLQVFINSSFENITSTENALNLLKKFQNILRRESLKADLESKYMVIFHNYGLDLENVQKTYERHKHSPPMVRNAPPVAGNLMWCRQLLRRIEEPMKKFEKIKAIMNTKESKKIIKTYNKVARALVEFETLWLGAWERSVETAKAGLNSTLLIRYPENGPLYVNFDREIFQLIRETKALIRLGVDIPEAARMILMQEEKYKTFFNQLTYTVKEYEKIIMKITPATRQLLIPHIEDLNRKIQPGLFVLTWNSLNIDVYLAQLQTSIARFEELVVKVNDIVENRIDCNLRSVGKTLLVDLPADHSFSLSSFVQIQEKSIKAQCAAISIKSAEVGKSVDDLVQVVSAYPLEANLSVSQEKIKELKDGYHRLLVKAVLQSVTKSLNEIKRRIGSRSANGFLFVDRPFFDVNVELSIPDVTLSPSLDEVQEAINKAARSVVHAAKNVKDWPGWPEEFIFNEVAKRKEVVKIILLLTGGIHGLKKQVSEYLAAFKKYEYLWKDDKQTAYEEFMKSKPDLDDFEAELKKYMAIEHEITNITGTFYIGSLSLQTANLKSSLKAEANAWKSQYAKNLHSQARSELQRLGTYMDNASKMLQREVKDLEDLRAAMVQLKELRDLESEIDLQFKPVEEMYHLLVKYDVRVPKEETVAVGDLNYKWDKLRRLAYEVNQRVAQVQPLFKRDLIKAVKAFSVDVIAFRNEFEANGPMVPGIKPQEAMERLKKYLRLFEERQRKFETYSAGHELFGLPKLEYPELAKTEKELRLLERLYGLYLDVIHTVNGYADLLWKDLDFKAITDEVALFAGQCKKLPKQLRDWDAFKELKQTIDDFLELQPLLEQLSDKAMRPRHWGSIMNMTGKTFKLEPDVFKLRDILEANLLHWKEDIEEICVGAVKEAEIEVKMRALVNDWADMSLTLAEFKTRGPIILKGQETTEILEKLEDSQMTLGSLASSRYVEFFRKDVSEWLIKLSNVAENIELWRQVQSMWMYLEAVFASGDIAKQLPAEAKRFSGIDKSWYKIMTAADKTRNVVEFCYGNELLKGLPYLREQLEVCQKSLSGYLEQKRNCFPRFYFVSDPVLLEILSQSSDPHSIQKHLQSIFDSIFKVTFDVRDKNKILVMHSPEGESVDLVSPVIAAGNVEDWLTKLEAQMAATMREIVRDAAGQCGSLNLFEFIRKFPAQVALLGIQFVWTADSQQAFIESKTNKKAVPQALDKAKKIMADLTDLTTQNLDAKDRTNIETLITIQVHQRDVFEELAKAKIRDPADFEWQKQARFYWKPDQNNCIISIADIDFEYCYEYLGCKERLVITPLTDRCYITLSQALGMYLGGAPAGPAGTGKTETVKDLGRTLGKYVVVFNCSDQLDYRAMGKIFKGLAQSGAWGCFDEFNRIELEVLSVVAQQVQTCLAAIRDHKDTFVFTDGQVLKMIDKTGFFITMNPGYQGRVELPENLKALFRGVTMMVPDRRIIIKVKLASAGYQDNDKLSLKFHTLYRLCEQQLSKQPHYDFGLRNILSVLRTAGATKRSAPPGTAEDFLLMRTLRDMNTSKLVFEDMDLFASLINDLFPGMKAEKNKYPAVETAIADHIRRAGLVQFPTWVEKLVQLYETSLVRHGIMVVGPSGAGKTTCYNILQKALSDVDVLHKDGFRMNPKAITAPQMFGRLDAISNDWTDGIFAALWRRANDRGLQKNAKVWIICDGPVDAIWIENLNTVLDDNKLLTLANGDRIQMSPNVKMCFEVENLNNASPATVSRAGQIYMSESALGWKPVIEARLGFGGTGFGADGNPSNSSVAALGLKAPEAELIRNLFNKYFDDASYFVRKECSAMMSVPVVNPATTCLDLLIALRQDVLSRGRPLAEPHLERLFFYCLTWSVGGLLEVKDRTKFDTYLHKINKTLPTSGSDTMYEYFVNDNGEWANWQTKIDPWIYPGDAKFDFTTLYVPTLDSVRMEFLVSRIARQRKSVLLIGSSGTSKTVTLEQFLLRSNPEEMLFKKMNFSSATTPLIFQNTLTASIEKRIKHTYGPPGGKKMTLFIDDISMPEINEWGDQVTNEIVRQVVEESGLYFLESQLIGDRMTIADLQFVAAMNHPGGGKNDIPNRLKRHFSIFNVTLPSKTSIDQIYGSVLRGRYNAENGVTADILEVTEKLTEVTIIFWQKIAAKMLPTPSKFHYIWNLRDLSRIYQGLMSCPRDIVTSNQIMLALWKHECTRVFSDRLNTVDDKKWFDENIQKLVREHFPEPLAAKVERPDYFVNFLRDPKIDPETGEEMGPAPKIYEPIVSIPVLRERLEEFMRKFNESSKVRKLDLVLFDAAVKNLIRISRILAMPRGNALLVGVGGSGKQSLTRLASFIASYDTFQITLTKTYNQQNLFDDLRALYKTAGLQGKPVTFIFTDNEIKQETFLEFINMILSSGEVAGLFARDELDSIVNDLRPIAKKEKPDTIGKNDTWDNLYRFFINRVRDNLHIVLCFSPVGEKFRNRARKFPGLISGCTINWFFPWPEEALVDVAKKFLAKFEMDTEPETKEKVIHHMANVHRCMTEVSDDYFQRFRRNVYSTPRSYLSFIQNYKAVYADKYAQINSLAEKVNGGLSKLRQAGEDVKAMQAQLKVKEVSLAEAAKKTDELLKDITESTAKAEKKKAEVMAVKNVLEAEASVVAAGKAEAEKDLEAAKPALEAAEKALSAIKPNDIQMLKALKTPPDLVKRIFDGVLLLRHYPVVPVEMVIVKDKKQLKDSYPTSLGMMTESAFLPSLMNFARDNINDETVELLLPYLEQEDFNFERAQKSSGNVAGLCTWVSAMCQYHTIAKVVAPKREALRIAEENLRIANGKLHAKERELAQVEAELARIQADFDKAMKTKQELQDDAEKTRKKMEAANNLIGALAGERDRWTQQSNEFKDLIRRLVGDVAMACAFISYCGPFNSEFRSLLLKKYFYEDCQRRGIPVTKDLAITKFLVDEAQVGEWNLQGLPTDDHSTQNGIMITRSSKWPLLIDPQGQGLAWLRKKLEQKLDEGQTLRVCQLTDSKFRFWLEECLSFGKPMIIENVEEEIDPFLDPVLEKAIIKTGRNSQQIILSDKPVDYSDSFQLFLTTKLANPHFSPELFAKTTIVDFTVTMDGLEQQLLGRVIQKEKAELEEQREKLLADVNVNQRRIKKLEDDLLECLSSSEGNLLENENLIVVLGTTKRTALEVKEKLNVAFDTEKRINSAREEYRPVATRGSVLYFLIVEMSLLNPMYQTSLKQFLALFDDSITKSEKAGLASKRIQNIIEHCTYSVYLYISRGLFEKHKLLFVLLMTCKILLRAREITDSSFNTLLKGGASLDILSARRKPFDWIPDNAWLNILQLADSVKNFKELPDLIQRTENMWKWWYDHEAPETQKVPDIDDRLDSFDRLLIVRCFREDRAMLAASKFVNEKLSKAYVDPVPQNLEVAWSESTERIPLICLLSPGSDPTAAIEALAKKKKKEIRAISMGQGQEEAAKRLIQNGFATGSWVLLQNCHLGLNFLVDVEQNILPTEEVHPEFRLWITSEPHPKFPIGLLQMSIKLTNEAPQGIKAGLKRSYQWVNQDMLDAFRRLEWKPLLYTTCFLHTLVQERRKFGPLGWNVPYEFNQTDLSASVQFLQNHMGAVGDDAKRGQLSWPTIKYMVCEVQYGGRITDDFDRRLFNTYGMSFMDPKIFAPGFEFSPAVPGYNPYIIPSGDDIQKYRDFIDGLPLNDRPEVLGLHPNADISYRTKQSQESLSTILDIQPKQSSGSGGATREEIVLRIADDLQRKVPDQFVKDRVKEQLDKLGAMRPLTIFLGQEVDRLDVVIGLIRRTLTDLKLAIAGTIIMSANLQNALNSLFDGRVPASWLKVSWASPTLGLWFADVITRTEQLSKWLENGRPKTYWLTGFFNPQGFLTAVRQEVTRAHSGWALDDVILKTDVMKMEREEVKDAPAEGVYIHGLFLDCAAWDKKSGRIIDPPPKILFTSLPVLYVTAIQTNDKKKQQVYVCPCYRNPTRTDRNYIFDVELPCDEPPSKWILRGVALLCSKD